MDAKTQKRLFNLSKTIKNSEDKIKSYQKKLTTEKNSVERKKLNLKIEIEQIRIALKKKEGELIMFSNK